jgi:hypothetical protein
VSQTAGTPDNGLVLVARFDVRHLLLEPPDLTARGQRQMAIHVQEGLVVSFHPVEGDLHVDCRFAEGSLRGSQVEL